MIVDAIKAAYTADATLVALTPGGMFFEKSPPGTAINRIVYTLPDDGIFDTRTYCGKVRVCTFLFVVYANSLNQLRQILARMQSTSGPFENKVYSLTSPEVSGGSRFDEQSLRIFENDPKRVEGTAAYEYVAEIRYRTIINNPQF